MLERFREQQFPLRGLAVLLIFSVCLTGLLGVWGISNALPSNGLCTKLLELGLGGDGVSLGLGSLLVNGAMISLTGIDPGHLPGILEAGLPVAAFDDDDVTTALAKGLPQDTGEQPLLQQIVSADRQLGYEVAIYHTHNAETYVPLDGKSKVDGKNGGVSLVGEEIVRVLGKAGIKAVHDLTIHDYPDFPTSYIKSEATALRLVEENPDLKVLIDLHRDAGLPKKETVKIGGEDVARILLVVGNGERLANPHWRENYAFAQSVAHLLEERYPGVLKAVRVKEGRYNQHVFPHAVLVEVGSEKNTLEECLRAARCLANVLVEVVEESRSSERS